MITLIKNQKTNNQKLLAAKFPNKERCKFACGLVNDEKNTYKPVMINNEWRMEKQIEARPILGYCDYSETIRQMPENYLIAHKDGNAWKCVPDLAANKELCIKVFTELLNHESKYQASGLELLAKLTPTY